ncbi:MAG: YifB family Mg chelatase-like AAA ATPase [Dermabacter sp.]|nr:YifB family Mg chelatase-like AAA ATPase [Dermabacter sp.]
MTVARTLSMSLRGLEGTVVEVETEVSAGLPAFTIVGLPDSSTLQARERVRGACAHSGHSVASKRLTVNLTPAWIPKQGSNFDVAIAMSALASLGVMDPRALSRVLFLGELTLDGELRPVPGVLPSLLAAARAGIDRAVVPVGNAEEAALVPGIQVSAIAHLADAVRDFGGEASASVTVPSFEPSASPPGDPQGGPVRVGEADADGSAFRGGVDFAEIHGQERGTLAAQVAAAGGHHLLLLGPPGTGKTMIASRLPTIMPELDDARALELSAIASVAGVFDARAGLVRTPPFVAPHHSATPASIIGGGAGIAGPGAVSRAHGGVLFLDEAPEFSPRVLEALREPLETGDIALHRARGVTVYPARFQLVLAANPCPCGRAHGRGDACTCTAQQKRRYLTRLSGPILDRIDLRVRLGPARPAARRAGTTGLDSAHIRARVIEARGRQAVRLHGTPWRLNAHVSGRFLSEHMPLDGRDEAILTRALERGALTMRGRDRVRRLAWSVADLAGRDRPTSDDLATALDLRGHDAL